jgi:hypothetical protein
MIVLNKEYLNKQLWLIENELEDVHNTMSQHDFELNISDVQNIKYSVNIRVENIKREIDNEIGYDKLLDQWFDKVINESEKLTKSADKQDDYTYKKGYNIGYAHGLVMATSILNRMEKKLKKKSKGN